MTQVTEFDALEVRATEELADAYIAAAHAEDFARCEELEQVLYAKWFRTVTGGFWRPEGHPLRGASSKFDMNDSRTWKLVNVKIAEAAQRR